MAKTIVDAETTISKKTRKTPVPQQVDRITEGALRLELKDRVALKNVLSDSISKELEEMETNLQNAKKLMNGKE